MALLLTVCGALRVAAQQPGGELRFTTHYEPRTFNPLMVEEQAEEMIRYITGGVLVRANRVTQQLEPEIAKSWRVLDGNRTVVFELRPGLAFSDGTPCDASDVAFTMRELMRPDLHSATGDAFRSGPSPPSVKVLNPHSVAITFGAPVAEIVRMFDQVAIMSARSPKKEMAVLGPFFVAEHKAGAYLVLRRNPHYWKRDAKGRGLPYLDGIRVQFQSNRELDALAFRRGEQDLITTLDPLLYEQLAKETPGSVRDLGPAMDSEFLWFNETAALKLPAFKREWFRNTAFRRAISTAINREDICRVVYRGHARPAAGPHPPSNRPWYNTALQPHRFDPRRALEALRAAGFTLNGGVLRDARGNPVAFSLITNAGNKTRERIAAMIQRDLKGIGVQVSIATLDFPSVIERIAKTYEYDACLLGLTNVDVDPNGMMNVWLSSSNQHQWNPNQKTPETPWEAEIDRNMHAQAALPDQRQRRAHWDRVQQIIREQEPFIYLVHPNALAAIAPRVHGVALTPLRPQLLSTVDQIYLEGAGAAGK